MHFISEFISQVLGWSFINSKRFWSVVVVIFALVAYFSPATFSEGVRIYANRQTASLMKSVFNPIIDSAQQQLRSVSDQNSQTGSSTKPPSSSGSTTIDPR
jgi:hypothetical protein